MALVTKNYITGYAFTEEQLEMYDFYKSTPNLSYLIDITIFESSKYFNGILKKYLDEYHYDILIKLNDSLEEYEFKSLLVVEVFLTDNVIDFDINNIVWRNIKKIDSYFNTTVKVNDYEMFDWMQFDTSKYENEIMEFLEDDNNKIVTICGRWGIGKTSFIKDIMHLEYMDEYEFFYNDISAIEVFSSNINYLLLHESVKLNVRTFGKDKVRTKIIP